MSKIIIIDIETSGHLCFEGKIVEIGIVELDLDNGNRKILYDKITHEKDITKSELEDSWIINNSNLNIKEILNSKRLDLIKNEVQEIINNYPTGATAYHNKFEFDFLESRDFTFPKKLPCPMILSTDIIKIPKNYNRKLKINKKEYKFTHSYKYPTVKEAYNYFLKGSNYFEEHRAVKDALNEVEIVYELYKLGFFKLLTKIKKTK